MSTQISESRVQTRLRVEDASHVGECRRTAQGVAATYAFSETLIGRVGIVATELANNLVRHAGRGELLIQAITEGPRVTLELVAIDQGPGMDVERCMRDGYSTAGTAGIGLGALSRLSSLFDLYSMIGRGTVAVARIAKPLPAEPPHASDLPTPDIGAICIAVAGEIECGDTWRIAAHGGTSAILLADGLGHGPLAATASRAAADAFVERPFDSPADLMERLHRALSGGRGAAAACALLSSATGNVDYAGVGNIAGRVVSAERSRGMVSHNGILGVQLLRRQKFQYTCEAGSRVVMHSDGMSARWSLDDYPGLLVRHAAVIAGVLYRDHVRARDDVTVVVSGTRQ